MYTEQIQLQLPASNKQYIITSQSYGHNKRTVNMNTKNTSFLPEKDGNIFIIQAFVCSMSRCEVSLTFKVPGHLERSRGPF